MPLVHHEFAMNAAAPSLHTTNHTIITYHHYTIIQYTTGTYYEHTIIRYHPHAIIRLDSVLIPSEGATNATNAHTISTHS